VDEVAQAPAHVPRRGAAAIDIQVLYDRSQTIRASVDEVKSTLLIRSCWWCW